jgi:predicted DNA-binding protein YlxM (UPF0122 family)
VGIFITKEYIMKKIVRLTESDLTRIVRGVITEDITSSKLEKVKDRIPSRQYDALNMKYVDDKSITDIADKFGMSVPTVKYIIKKGLESVDKQSDLLDSESKVTDDDRKKVKIELFQTKLITMVDQFLETLSQEDINKVLRKIIK